MLLENRVAIVTGGGRGIGRAIVKRFAQEGAKVVIAQRDQASGESTRDDVRAVGGTAIFVQTDISKRETVKHLAEETVAEFGGIDILVNNAAKLGLNGPFLETTQEEWDKVIGTNLTGAFMCGQECARVMAHSRRGSIINISSINGTVPLPHCCAYASAKGGMNILTRSMAIDLAPYGIRVNVLSPGPIQSRLPEDAPAQKNMHALLGRRGLTKEIASAALFLASDEASFITGESLTVDGGSLVNGYWLYHAEKLWPDIAE